MPPPRCVATGNTESWKVCSHADGWITDAQTRCPGDEPTKSRSLQLGIKANHPDEFDGAFGVPLNDHDVHIASREAREPPVR